MSDKEITYFNTRLDRCWVLWHSTNTWYNEDVSWVNLKMLVFFDQWPLRLYAFKDKADSYVIHPLICSSVFSTTVDDRHAVHCGARERVGMRWRHKKARPKARAPGRGRVFFAGARWRRAFSWKPWRRAVMKVCAHMDREDGAAKRKGRSAALIFCAWIRLQRPRRTKEALAEQLAAEGYLRSNGKLPSALSASARWSVAFARKRSGAARRDAQQQNYLRM